MTDSLRFELAVELLGGGRLGGHVDDGVDALGLLLDVVGETATAPDVDVVDGAAVLLDDGEELVERRGDGALFELRVEDDHEFVLTHALTHLLWSWRSRSLRDRRVALRPAAQPGPGLIHAAGCSLARLPAPAYGPYPQATGHTANRSSLRGRDGGPRRRREGPRGHRSTTRVRVRGRRLRARRVRPAARRRPAPPVARAQPHHASQPQHGHDAQHREERVPGGRQAAVGHGRRRDRQPHGDEVERPRRPPRSGGRATGGRTTRRAARATASACTVNDLPVTRTRPTMTSETSAIVGRRADDSASTAPPGRRRASRRRRAPSRPPRAVRARRAAAAATASRSRRPPDAHAGRASRGLGVGAARPRQERRSEPAAAPPRPAPYSRSRPERTHEQPIARG